MANQPSTAQPLAPASEEGTPLVAAPHSAPDELLVAAAQAGDAHAFDELVSRHAGRVYGLVARLLGDRTAAEDVTQEAFVRAWRGLASFRGEAQFSTWLYRIAVNEANRALGRESRREHVLYEDVMAHVPDLTADVPSKAEASELRHELEGLLADLPASHRVAVVLRDVEGLTNEEAAAQLGLEVRSFKSRLHRGRMALRQKLEELHR